MKKIPLTQGKFALVDDDDFEYLSQWKWSVDGKGYAVRGCGIKMHRLIMGAPADFFCDHINGVRLDNRKENLRLVTNKQNLWNRGKASNNTSGYKGVNFQNGKWHVSIMASGIKYHFGCFETKEKAAAVYNEKAKEIHGEYARINVIPEQ